MEISLIKSEKEYLYKIKEYKSLKENSEYKEILGITIEHFFRKRLNIPPSYFSYMFEENPHRIYFMRDEVARIYGVSYKTIQRLIKSAKILKIANRISLSELEHFERENPKYRDKRQKVLNLSK